MAQEVHSYLSELLRRLDKKHPDRLLLLSMLSELQGQLSLIQQIKERRLPNFSTEQVKGLNEAGFTFRAKIEPKSVAQLIEEGVEFETLHQSDLELLSRIKPSDSEAAINPNQLSLPGSNDFSPVEQLALVRTFGDQLKQKRLYQGTLEGVEFGMERVSVYAQLDRAYLKAYLNRSREPLFHNINATTLDVMGPYFVGTIGRAQYNEGLIIGMYRYNWVHPNLWAVPVAYPVEAR